MNAYEYVFNFSLHKTLIDGLELYGLLDKVREERDQIINQSCPGGAR